MLRPNGLAPARHHRFAKVPPGVPFATPARESRRALLECLRANPRGHDVQRFSGAQVSAGNLVATRLEGEMVCAFHAGLRIVRAGSFHSVAALRCYCAKLSAHTLRCKI